MNEIIWRLAYEKIFASQAAYRIFGEIREQLEQYFDEMIASVCDGSYPLDFRNRSAFWTRDFKAEVGTHPPITLQQIIDMQTIMGFGHGTHFETFFRSLVIGTFQHRLEIYQQEQKEKWEWEHSRSLSPVAM